LSLVYTEAFDYSLTPQSVSVLIETGFAKSNTILIVFLPMV